MTMIRSVLFTVWLYGAIGVVGLVGMPLAVLSRSAARAVVPVWAAIVLFGARWIMGIRWQVRGLDNLPPGPALIAPKHQSMMDTIVPFLFLKPLPAFVLKQELLNMPVFGWYCRRAGMIAIDRDGHMKALKQMVAEAREQVALGRSIIIFPEGTRQEPGSPPDYKPGVAAIYGLIDLPCVPVALDTARVWPAHGIAKRPGTATFEILPVIEKGLKRGPFMERLQSAVEPASAALLADWRKG
jgi:1-acyl-sn-glycerol-3-phosphate acyltransferase